MKSRNDLAFMLFEKWMSEKHPYHFFTVGALYLFFTTSLVFSIISLWIFPEIWWKTLITSVFGLGITKFASRAVIGIYVDEWKDSENLGK